jgi:hypothetical protein
MMLNSLGYKPLRLYPIQTLFSVALHGLFYGDALVAQRLKSPAGKSGVCFV